MWRAMLVVAAIAVATTACGSKEERVDDDTGTDVAEDGGGDVASDTETDPQPDTTEDAVDDSGGLASYRYCEENYAFCYLREPGCCESCRDRTLDDLVAVGAGQGNDFWEATCGEPSPTCPACEPPPIDPNLVAVCEEGVCQGRDIRQTEVTECAEAGDCMAIWADCCGCGPQVVAIAANQRQTYNGYVCDPAADCIDCPAVEPSEDADCVDGRCVLVTR